MKKTLLQEVKAMNRIAGTQMTKEQEITLIKNRLQELEFGTQKAFDAYKKNHDMRPDTKVTVAGKKTTVGQASKNSGGTKPKGKSVFGKPSADLWFSDVDYFKQSHSYEKLKPTDVIGINTPDGEVEMTYADAVKKYGGDTKTKSQSSNKGDTKAFYKKVRKLTDDNDHSQAAVELAKFMGDKKSIKTLEKIKNDHDKRGYITDKDAKIRNGITTGLLKKAKEQYKGRDYDKINGAF